MAHSPFDFLGSIKQLTLGFCLALNNWLSKTAAPDSSFFPYAILSSVLNAAFTFPQMPSIRQRRK